MGIEPGSDSLVTGEAVELDLRPTGWVLRAAGAVIDALLYLGAYIAILVALFNAAAAARSEDAVYGIIAIVALVLCLVIAPATVETATRGKSLGKLAVGARIVRDDGGAIGYRHAAIRALVGMFELYLSLGGIAAVTGLVTDRTRRIGDLVAGTYSQYERVSRIPPPVFGVPAGMEEWAALADVARMPDGLVRRVAQFLGQAGQLTPERRGHAASQLAAEVRRYVSPLPPVPPELFLAGVAVVRREREYAALHREDEHMERLGPALTGLPHGFPARGDEN
ncbi:MAG: RDD family protein [Microbacteriaceae bacterium]|nr:RDD family protein [Microbacteriaceae bacterium]